MESIIVEGLEQTEFKKLDNVSRTRDELIELYWHFHPRFRFFKTLTFGARLLDVGAGQGGLYHWKDWEPPERNDISLYAADLKRGDFFDKYEGYAICHLDKGPLEFGGESFDAIFMSHVLEHISCPDRLFEEIRRVAAKRARIYIEIPTAATLAFPARQVFLAKNINVAISNFFDDQTHLHTFSLADLGNMAGNHHLEMLESGVIENPFLEDELFTYGLLNNDQELTTYAVWSKLRWAQYMILEKTI